MSASIVFDRGLSGEFGVKVWGPGFAGLARGGEECWPGIKRVELLAAAVGAALL